jgi:hypothetical protein
VGVVLDQVKIRLNQAQIELGLSLEKKWSGIVVKPV